VASSPPNATDADRPPRPPWTRSLAAALAVGTCAFALYHATLLPGVDFGDTGSFQTTLGSPILTPRVGYPLYFAIAGAFFRVSGLEAAHALNLVSAIEAAFACALFVIAGTEISGSVAAAAAGAALFAVSYTFWSQAVIGEVYALHIALTLASLILLLAWERRPTTIRLAAFFACYAAAFGNHLSTILLAPAFTAFLLMSAPRGWRSMFAPRVVVLAAFAAALGAAQYLWNIQSLWFVADPPHGLAETLRRFWFDVTKSDWRDTMVLEVPRSLLTDHAAMYWFDLRQQFGLAGPVLALAGGVHLARTSRRRAWLLGLLYLVNVAFAFSYNVGDAHVFYLPSHLAIALAAAAGVAGVGRMIASGPGDIGGSLRRWPDRRLAAGALSTAAIALAALRGYRDYPALDRSADTRPSSLLEAMTAGIDDRDSAMLVDLNWQVANGLSYYAKAVRPQAAVARTRDVLFYAPAFVADNEAADRRVIASGTSGRILSDAFGPWFTMAPDGPQARSLLELAGDVPRGTRYALCVLKQSRDLPVDRAGIEAALAILAPGAGPLPAGDYVAVAGVAGHAPLLVAAADRPFSRTIDVDGTTVAVRMESWLASDTIRRMGFGHVIAGRRHTLIVERGVSFAAFDAAGVPLITSYFSSIFSLPQRYVIRTAAGR
jgi:hypothetical protein